MSKRYTVLGLSVVLALALSVPALGGPSNPIASISASAKKVANKALKKAKTAQTTAISAQSSADAALAEAKKALTAGNNAQGSANSAKSTADAAKAAAAAAQGTANAAQAAAAAAEANANTRFQDAEIVFGESTAESTTTTKTAGATCDESDSVMGGGFAVGGENEKVTVTASAPEFFYGEGWFASAKAISGTPTWSLQANAICGRR
jgi:hypothetical protein